MMTECLACNELLDYRLSLEHKATRHKIAAQRAREEYSNEGFYTVIGEMWGAATGGTRRVPA